jgi:hypothetical protein
VHLNRGTILPFPHNVLRSRNKVRTPTTCILLYLITEYSKYNSANPDGRASNAWVCGRLHAGIWGSNLGGGMDVFLVSVVCCQVEVSATGRCFVQKSPTECGVSQCDREASIMEALAHSEMLRNGKKKKQMFMYLH